MLALMGVVGIMNQEMQRPLEAGKGKETEPLLK